MSEHAYVVLFVSAHACGHVCVWMCKRTCPSWCTFMRICVGVYISVRACKEGGAGVSGNVIHFHWDVGCFECVLVCAVRWRVRDRKGDDK